GCLGVIEANMKYKNATLTTIRFLVETVQDNVPVRNYLIDHVDDWVEGWLVTQPSEGVREQAFNLFYALVPSERYVIDLLHRNNRRTAEKNSSNQIRQQRIN